MKIKHLFLSVLAVAMVAVGCKKDEVLGPASLKAGEPELSFNADGGTETFELKATRAWTAEVKGSNTEGISVSPLEGKGSNDPVTITVTVLKNEGANRTATIEFKASATLSATVTIKQDGAKGDVKTVANVLALPKGTTVNGVVGTVVGVYTKGFVMQDETGMLLVYKEDATAPGAAIGEVVKVKGTTGKYGDLPQLVPTEITKEKDGEEVTYPEPLVITADNISTFDIKKVQYIKMSGRYTEDGNYKNLAIEGTAVKGSISYPVAELGLDKLVGHNIDVYGYFAGGNNANYRNILVVKVEDKGAAEITVSTIKDVLDAAVGATVKTSGTVKAFNKCGFIIGDATGVIYVLKDLKGEWTSDVKVGNKIELEGTRGVYNDGPQITGSTYKITDEATPAQSYADAKDITSTIDSYVVSSNELVSVTGVMDDKGRYVQPADAQMKISLNYTTESYTALSGLTVTVRGYVLSNMISSTDGSKYAISMLLAEIVPEPFVQADALVKVAASATNAVIPVKSNVSWTVTSEGSADWVKDFTKSGNGNGEITVNILANEADTPREAVFTITAEGVNAPVEVTLSQGKAGAGAASYELTFPDDNKSSNGLTTNQYATTWTAKKGGNSWSIANFNNNNWDKWTYIRAGNKNKASEATITTGWAITEAISTVEVTVDAVTASYIKTTYLEVSTDNSFPESGTQKVTLTAAKGKMIYEVPTPTAGCYYRLTYDCAQGKSNGLIQISKIVYAE